MEKIKVWICGPFGKMGSTLCSAIEQTDDIQITGLVSPDHTSTTLDIQGANLEVFESLEKLSEAVELPDAIVDFTVASACYNNALFAAQNKVSFVTGTTGISKDDMKTLEVSFDSNKTSAVFASNFSVGAVLMMRYAAQSAKHFENAEIVEIHHTQKVDAPSGTALRTQEMMVESSDFNEKEIPIHSVRLPGAIAHQNIYFSSPGEVLRIEHDANDRKCFMPGIILAIRKVRDLNRVLFSIESLLFPADN